MKVKRHFDIPSVCEQNDMAEASVSVDRDQFSCPVCLDLLKDPVTINCGHSYCMGCIKGCWDQEAQRGVYSCPKCRQTFRSRPVLGRNNILAEMVEKLRETVASLDQNSPAGPTDVACDVCTAPKFKAVKSCLVCLASYCGTHLRLHSELNPGNRHKVIDNPDQMKKRICPYHNKPLNEFCCTDQKFICRMCVLDYHRGHDVLPVEAERAQKQGQIGTIQTQYRQRVLEREKKLRQLKQGIQSLKVSAQATVNEYEKMFTELVSSLKKKSSELTELIRSRERAELERTEGILKRLEKEIAELKRRDTELWQLSQCDDDWLFLQNFPSLSTLPGSEHFPNITVNLPSFGDTRKSVSELKKQVEALCRKECDKVSLQVKKIQMVQTSEPMIREDFFHYFHQLTVDTNSAYEYLGLTEGNRKITFMEEPQTYLQPYNHPERFNPMAQALCRESVSGRSYWEVEWGGSQVYIAVSYKGIERKGCGCELCFGHNAESWSLSCSPDKCSYWHNDKETVLPVQISSRIGVFLDQSAGTLSFFSVSDTMTLLYRARANFDPTQRLCPGFWVFDGANVKLCQISDRALGRTTVVNGAGSKPVNQKFRADQFCFLGCHI